MAIFAATTIFGPFGFVSHPTIVTVKPGTGSVVLAVNAGTESTPDWQDYKTFTSATDAADLSFELALADAHYRFTVTGNATFASRGMQR